MSVSKVPTVDLLTRQGCHLCEAARQTLTEVTTQLGLSFEEIDVDSYPELKERHDTEVPVVRVDGEVKDFWQINGRRLAKILKEKMA